jgi:hypothetical protein
MEKMYLKRIAVTERSYVKGATLKNVSFAPPFSLSKKYYSHQDHEACRLASCVLVEIHYQNNRY